MNFVDFVIDCYTHITSHVTQVFASCTHYISYSLLNIVHVIVCVFRSDQPSLKLLWVFFLCKTYFVFEILKGECLKILIFGKLGLKLVFWKSISSHSYAFYSLYSSFVEYFQKSGCFSLKFYFFIFSIDPICFRSIEISFKILGEPLSVSINWNCFLINWISWISFFLKTDLDLFKSF